MKNKIIIVIAVLFIVAAGFAYLQTNSLNVQKEENGRLTKNQTALNSELKTWKTKDSTNVATIAGLAYTQSETKDFNPELIQTVKELKLELKNVQSILNTRTITSTKIKTEIRDSISLVDTLKCFKYEDKFTKLNGCFTGDTIGIEMKTFDSLTTVISRVPKHKFLFWTWGVKGINVNILSKNPNTTFDYAKYIELK